jgi:hypothetical protein
LASGVLRSSKVQKARPDHNPEMVKIFSITVIPACWQAFENIFCIQVAAKRFLTHRTSYAAQILKLKNFRGYRNSTEIIIDEGMTGIVGRNDFGKSTLLEALAIFLQKE